MAGTTNPTAIKIMTVSGEQFCVCAYYDRDNDCVRIAEVERITKTVEYASPYVMMSELQDAVNQVVEKRDVSGSVDTGARMMIRNQNTHGTVGDEQNATQNDDQKALYLYA